MNCYFTGSTLLVLVFLLLFLNSCTEEESRSPANVLFIMVDDLNDWVGCLGGHPQAVTPNIDRLAARGMLFANAHCQSPVCNPSRASLMTSLYPSTTGIYFLNPDLKESDIARSQTLMPQRFKEEGYRVAGAGKLFHYGGMQNENYVPNFAGRFGGLGPGPKKRISSYDGHPLWDWGPFPEREEDMPDYQIASWAAAELAAGSDSVFWLGVGFHRPHVPQFVPQKWFDLYPLEDLQLPAVLAEDLQDIPDYGLDITGLEHVAPTHKWVTENGEWKALVQSYLACVSFVDDQIGRVLTALENSPHAENTYVVLLSDHGFHLGEKEHYAKRSLWNDATRVPMIIAGPGISAGQICQKPVQLLDIYPTLLDLNGLEPDPRLEGHSLLPLLQDITFDWPHMARISFGPGNYAIVSESYRLIQYQDGSEEFYRRAADPHEWHNVAEDPAHQQLMEAHRLQLPIEPHPILGKMSTGHRAYEAAGANVFSVKE